MKYFLSLLLLVSTLVACSPQATDYEQVSEKDKIVIRFSHVVGEDTPKGQAARMFAKLVNERTKGKVEVQVFSNSSLFKDSEELNALADGHVQMIAPALSKMSHVIPELGVFDLPYLYPDLAGYHKVFDGEVGNLLARSIDKNDMLLLAFWDSGMKQFTNNVRPVSLPQDLAGTTFRIMPSQVLNQQFNLLQVHPVPINFDEVYSALEHGKIQGEENTVSNIYSKRFYQVQKYMTLSDHGYLGYVVVMDKKFWQHLSPDIQSVIKQAMKEVTDWQRTQAVQLEQQKLQEIKACKCIQITQLHNVEKQQWKQSFQPLYQEVERQVGSDFFNKLNVNP